MRIVGIIQARLDSKRLPKKVLMDLNGMPVIKHIYRRLLKVRGLDEVVISWGCTCEKDEKIGCQPCISKVTEAFGFMPRIWTGPESNIVERHLGAAYATRADAVLRITGDCPFVDPLLAERMIEHYRECYPRYEVTTNWYPKMMWPDGLDMEIQSVVALQQMAAIKDFPKEEYLGDMLKCGLFKCGLSPSAQKDWSDLRLTLDTPEDLEAFRKIFAVIGNDQWDWTEIPRMMIPVQKRPDYISGYLTCS